MKNLFRWWTFQDKMRGTLHIDLYSTASMHLWNLKKNWYLLTNDSNRQTYTGDRPNITFWRPKSLKDRLTQSHYVEQKDEDIIQRWTWKCNLCNYCSWFFENHTMYLPNGKLHSIPHQVNCQTIGVVYIMFCECGSFYVGKTKQCFWRRIKDHIYYIGSNLPYISIGRHVNFQHSGNIKFVALECIVEDPRGGDFDKRILQTEMLWIHNLKATTPPGLNDAVSYKPFLCLLSICCMRYPYVGDFCWYIMLACKSDSTAK